MVKTETAQSERLNGEARTTARHDIEAFISDCLADGLDPTAYRAGLVEAKPQMIDEIDQLLASAGTQGPPLTRGEEEDRAQARIANDRRLRRTNRADWNRHNHEEM